MIELYELAGRDEELRFSPFCWRTRLALAHKGVEARIRPWHFGQNGLPDGCDTVPVLVDGGKVIGDSTDIAFHLEAKYHNGPSLFTGEGGEDYARFMVAWADTRLQPALLPLLALHVLAQVKPEAASYYRESREARLGMRLEQAAAERERHLDNVRGILAPVRQVVEKQEYLGGAEPSYVDYVVFGAFQWARCLGGPELVSEGDPMFGWRERMLDLFEGLAREAKTAGE